MKTRLYSSVSVLVLCAGSVFAQANLGAQQTPAATKPVPTSVPTKDGGMRQMTPEEIAKMKAQMEAKNGLDIDVTKEVPVDDANPASQVVFVKQSAEFGVIGDDTTMEFEFPFTNKGNKDLEFLGQPTGSCGCTIPNLEKLVYKPGESGVIKGSFNPNHKNGPTVTKVTCRTNDPTKPTFSLNVKSEVRPIFRAEPTFLNIGQIARGNDSKQTFRIVSRKESVKVTQVTPQSPKTTVNVLPTEVKNLENGETVWETPVEVTVSAKDSGQVNENITIRSSDSAKTLSVVVMGAVMGDITISPEQLSLPGLTPGQAVNSEFTLTSQTGGAFVVKGVQEVAQGGASPFMKFDYSQVPGANPPAWKVKITGDAPSAQGALRGEIVIDTDNANDPQMRLRYFGFVRQQTQVQPTKPAASSWTKPSALDPDGK